MRHATFADYSAPSAFIDVPLAAGYRSRLVSQAKIRESSVKAYRNQLQAEDDAMRGVGSGRDLWGSKVATTEARRHRPVHAQRRVPIPDIAFSTSRRIGDAKNPGPYQEGGASSSNFTVPRLGLPSHDDQNWTFPVKFSDADSQHRFGTTWLFQEDVLPFLQDELYGEDWDIGLLHETMEEIKRTGHGEIDPVKLIRGSSEYTRFVPPPQEVNEDPRRYNFCPKVSSADDPKDLVLAFLRGQEKSKNGPACAEAAL